MVEIARFAVPSFLLLMLLLGRVKLYGFLEPLQRCPDDPWRVASLVVDMARSHFYVDCYSATCSLKILTTLFAFYFEVLVAGGRSDEISHYQ